MAEQQAFIDETILTFNLSLTVIPFCHKCKKPLRVALKHFIGQSTVSIDIIPCEHCIDEAISPYIEEGDRL